MSAMTLLKNGRTIVRSWPSFHGARLENSGSETRLDDPEYVIIREDNVLGILDPVAEAT